MNVQHSNASFLAAAKAKHAAGAPKPKEKSATVSHGAGVFKSEEPVKSCHACDAVAAFREAGSSVTCVATE